MQNNLIFSLIINSVYSDSVNLLKYLLEEVIILNKESFEYILELAIINNSENCVAYIKDHLNELSLNLNK